MSTMTITVIEAETVDQINQEHELCRRAYGDALAHAIEAGRLLAGVKAQMRHGEFMPWVAERFAGSQRTANVYMQLAAAPQIQDSQHAANLGSLRGALDDLAPPRPPSPAQSTDQLRRLGAGRSPELERRLAESRARTVEDAWSEPERRKLARARDQLEDVLSRLDDGANTTALSRDSIGRLVREQAVAARQAASVLDDLAFSFER